MYNDSKESTGLSNTYDNTSNEDVRQQQQKLNELGYTDKFGEKLKEDGIEGAKTRYAKDKYEVDLNSKNKFQAQSDDYDDYDKYGVVKLDENGKPFKSPYFVALPGADLGPVPGGTGYEYSPPLKFDENGIIDTSHIKSENISPGDEQYSSTKQTMIKSLSRLWHINEYDTHVRNNIHIQAKGLRTFNDEKINSAYLLNITDGAKGMGHNAIMLVDEYGYGVIFSVYPTDMSDVLETRAELRFASLNKSDTDSFLKNNGKKTYINNMVATDGWLQKEEYDRLIEFKISNDQGSKMFEFAVNRYTSPGIYKLLWENCDHFATDCLKEGGVDIFKLPLPNWTYELI